MKHAFTAPLQDYEGPREADGIIKYMRGQAGPSAKEIKTVAEFEKFVNSDDSAVLGEWLVLVSYFSNAFLPEILSPLGGLPARRSLAEVDQRARESQCGSRWQAAKES